jgi:hypothetical protein
LAYCLFFVIGLRATPNNGMEPTLPSRLALRGMGLDLFRVVVRLVINVVIAMVSGKSNRWAAAHPAPR